MNSTQTQIVDYLAQGFKPSEVARIFGLSEGYISQQLRDEDFLKEVSLKTAETQKKALKIDQNYTTIEEIATDKIKSFLNSGIYKPIELLAVANMANKAAKKFSSLSPEDSSSSSLSVTIQLPANLVGLEMIASVKTKNNEVLSVNGVSLAPLSVQKLDELNEVNELEVIKEIDDGDDY